MQTLFLFCLLSAAAAVFSLPAPQAGATPAPSLSPQVLPDGRVSFRFRAPHAQSVALSLEGYAQPIAMHQDEAGVWSVEVGPLAPEFYGYAFVADGVTLLDPANTVIKPNLLSPANEVHVPGPAELPWELAEVPHGELHHHFYASSLVGGQREFYVYTPPGYEPCLGVTYPVLYLLHGFSDDPSAWSAVGRAQVILDNLIARGKVKPMIVVMPDGYGAPQILSYGFAGIASHQELWHHNLERFSQVLLTEVIPRVEGSYRVQRARGSRAIAGLSMGGAEALGTGLNHPELFAWVGGFSAALFGDLAPQFPGLGTKAGLEPRLLWVACGTEDHLIAVNRNFRQFLASKGVAHTDVETPGAHTWMVWRDNLAHFAPLLFR